MTGVCDPSREDRHDAGAECGGKDSCVVGAEVGDGPDGSEASIRRRAICWLFVFGVVVLFLPVSFWVEFSWGEGIVAGGHAGALGPERRRL